MSSLLGKVALVTGGGRGIGRAIVYALAEAGSTVAFTYRSSAAASEEIIKELTGKGLRVVAYQSDASSTLEAARVVDSIVKEFSRLDILVNNAGITKDTLLMRMSEDDWDRVITNNLKSVFNFTKAACRQMMSQRIMPLPKPGSSDLQNLLQKSSVLAIFRLMRLLLGSSRRI
jgi:3-oxoacyl-[acyl-carrier protein] reductase